MNTVQSESALNRSPWVVAAVVVWSLAVFSQHSHADAIYFGVASGCTPQAFELVGFAEANGVVGFAGAANGVKPLATGEHRLTCTVNGAALVVDLRVFGGDSGYCMGAGYVDITQIRVNKAPLDITKSREPFNWSCPKNPMLVRVRIEAKDQGLIAERCSSAQWSWEVGYAPQTCTSRAVTPLVMFRAILS